MGYVEGANASNLQCLEYLSQDKCLSSLHKGLCSNPCVQVSVYKGSQWALFVARDEHDPLRTLMNNKFIFMAPCTNPSEHKVFTYAHDDW